MAATTIDPILATLEMLEVADGVGAELPPFETALLACLKSVAYSNLALLSGGQTITVSPEPPRQNLDTAAREAFGRGRN